MCVCVCVCARVWASWDQISTSSNKITNCSTFTSWFSLPEPDCLCLDLTLHAVQYKKKDMNLFNLTVHITLESKMKKKKSHVTDPTWLWHELSLVWFGTYATFICITWLHNCNGQALYICMRSSFALCMEVINESERLYQKGPNIDQIMRPWTYSFISSARRRWENLMDSLGNRRGRLGKGCIRI